MFKLGKYVLFGTGVLLFVVVSSSIYKQRKIREEEEMIRICNDTLANFDSDSLTFRFRGLHNFKQIVVTHRRKGYEVVIPYKYTNQEPYFKDDYQDGVLIIRNPDFLYKHDTIRVVVNSKTIYDISGFENDGVFRGRRFAGCFLVKCIVNGFSSSLSGDGLLYLR